MARVPETPAPPKALPEGEPVVVPQNFEPPMELVVHQGGIGVRKIESPVGTLTLIQIMSPMGLMVTLKFDDDGVEHLIQQLRGSNLVVPPKGIIIPQ